MDEPLPDIQALQNSDAFQSLTQYVEAFDVFNVMGVSNKELVHSTVLANLMRGQASHGLGTRFRDALISHLCQARCMGPGLPDSVLRSTAGATAKISRELAQIDILLDFPQLRLVVAIENKLWAEDQKDQVKRYQQTLRELYPQYQSFALVYLTPTGRDSPTRDPDSPVPVYCVSYAEVATLLAREQQHATVAAAGFIEQFIAHIGKTMSGTTELKDRCWEVFKQHEEACERLASNLQYCRFRRLTEVFDELERRLLGDEMFRRWQGQLQIERTRPNSEQDKHFFDLDLRLAHWPKGVWVKIYKHNWFGVFPLFFDEYLGSAAALRGIFTPARPVPDWTGLYYASAGFELKDDRRIPINGNRISEADINMALTKADHYLGQTDQALTQT